MAPPCGALPLLAAILVFADASKTIGKTKDGTTILLDMSSWLGTETGKLVKFNADHKLDVVIDRVMLSYMDACANSEFLAGGLGESYLNLVIDPMRCPKTSFSLLVQGRLLSGDVEEIEDRDNDQHHYTMEDVPKSLDPEPKSNSGHFIWI